MFQNIDKVLTDLRAKRERQYKAYKATVEHIEFLEAEQTRLLDEPTNKKAGK